jgi:hypothetical protein
LTGVPAPHSRWCWKRKRESGRRFSLQGAITNANEQAALTGVPGFEAIDPLILTMPDNTYRHLGSIAGTAWSAGKKLMKRT